MAPHLRQASDATSGKGATAVAARQHVNRYGLEVLEGHGCPAESTAGPRPRRNLPFFSRRDASVGCICTGTLLLGVLAVSGCGSGSDMRPARSIAMPTAVALTTSELTSAFGTPSAAALSSTADVLRQRIALVDKDHTATVSILGDHLEVRASSTVTAPLAQLATGGRLAFWRVIEEGPATPGGTPSGGDESSLAMYQHLSCDGAKVDAAAPDAPTCEVVACSKDGTQKFHLGDAEVVGKDIKGASASANTDSAV